MPTMPFQEKVMLSGRYGIALCRAKDAAGRALFHYIKATRQELERLYRDYEKREPLDFASYGEILYSGWGEPTAEDEAMVKEKWGAK